MTSDRPPEPGWCYVLSHPAWNAIGPMCKLGSTRRDPAKRLAEITTSSGLIAPGKVVVCIRVSDRRRVEKVAHELLRHKRVRRRRELFRVTPDEARAAIERAAAGVESAPWRVDRPVRVMARRGPWQPPRRPWRRCAAFRWRTGDAFGLVVLALAALAALGGWW